MDSERQYIFLNVHTHVIVFYVFSRGNIKKIAILEFNQILDSSFEIANFTLMKDNEEQLLLVVVTKSNVSRFNGLLYSFEFNKKKFSRIFNKMNSHMNTRNTGIDEKDSEPFDEFQSINRKWTNQTFRTNKTNQSEKIRKLNLRKKLDDMKLEMDKESKNTQSRKSNVQIFKLIPCDTSRKVTTKKGQIKTINYKM